MQPTETKPRIFRYTLPLALLIGAQTFWLQTQKSELQEQRDACLEELQDANSLVMED